MNILVYERKSDGSVWMRDDDFNATSRWLDENTKLCTFKDKEHAEANGFPWWTSDGRKEWLAKMRQKGWELIPAAVPPQSLFKVPVGAVIVTEDPSAVRDREAMKNRPPVVQTSKPVPTPVERPLCPVGMLNVTPINKWGRPL